MTMLAESGNRRFSRREMSERVRGGEVERSHLDIDNDDDKIGPAMVSS